MPPGAGALRGGAAGPARAAAVVRLGAGDGRGSPVPSSRWRRRWSCGRRRQAAPRRQELARPSRRSPAGTWRLPGRSWMGGAGWRWWRRPSGAVRGCAALEDLHVRLAAVDQDAGQLAGEATHDLVEALLWSLAAELRGSGLATPPRSPWTWWPTCRPHRRAPGLRPVDAHRHAGRTALAAGRRDLALEVFAAANRPRPSAGLPGRAIPGAHRPATTPPSPPRSPVGRPGRRCRGTPAIPAQPVVS